MKNVTIYVDVDLTLIDESGRMIPGADAGVRALHDAGCRLYLWSTGGAEYCRGKAELLGIEDLFDAFLAKPDICIDDMPSTFLNSLIRDVQDGGWEYVVNDLLSHHIEFHHEK